MKKCVSFICVFVFLWSSTTAEPAIVISPTDFLTPTGSTGNATFDCTVSGEGVVIIWQVNEAQLDNQALKDEAATCCQIFIVDTSNVTSQLLIDLSVENRMVRCIAAVSILNRVQSPVVTIVPYDKPAPPENFKIAISSQEGELILSWDPPSNTPPSIPTTYNVTIETLEQPSQPYPGTLIPVSDTSMSFLENATVECTAYRFSVVASNGAGMSDPSVFMETVPLSPNIDFITASLMTNTVVSFDGEGNVNIALEFPLATACNSNFSIPFYLLNVTGGSVEGNVTLPAPAQGDVISTVLTPATDTLSGLAGDEEYFLTVRACTRLTPDQCDFQQSGTVRVVTTDVLSALATYIDLDNRVYLTCTFASGSPTTGCSYMFQLPNRTEPEVFNTTRDGSSPTASLCVTTENRANTYDKVEVVGLREDGTVGSLPVPVELIEEVDNIVAFSAMCPLPVVQPEEEEASLSDGAIAGIIIAIVFAVIIGAVILVAIVFFVLYKKRQVKTDKEGQINIKNLNIFGKKKGQEDDDGDDEDQDPIQLSERWLPKPDEAREEQFGASGSMIPPPDEPITEATKRAIMEAGGAGSPEFDEPLSIAGPPRSYPSESLLPYVQTTLTPMSYIPGSVPAVAELNISDLSNIRLRINPKVLKRVIRKRQRLQQDKANVTIKLFAEPQLQPSEQSMDAYL